MLRQSQLITMLKDFVSIRSDNTFNYFLHRIVSRLEKLDGQDSNAEVGTSLRSSDQVICFPRALHHQTNRCEHVDLSINSILHLCFPPNSFPTPKL